MEIPEDAVLLRIFLVKSKNGITSLFTKPSS